MKLLFCPECWDVFKLAKETRTCACGKVTGRYISNLIAESNGQGISIAIGNGSLAKAITQMHSLQIATKDLAGRDNYIRLAPLIAWVRPNEGEGNPHMKVVEP